MDEASLPTERIIPGSNLIGRARESVILHEELARTSNGAGSLVLLGGEAGIGKSSLATALAREAAESGTMLLNGNCFDLSNTPPYGPWLQVVATATQLRGAVVAPSAFAAGKLAAITDQRALYEDSLRYFRELSGQGPILLTLEDLHWADPASLSLLRYLSTHLRSMPIMLLATYRVDELTRQNPFYLQLPSLVRDGSGLRLDLKRLGLQDLQELVRTRWSLTESDVLRLAEYLDRHAEGNPFYAVELLRALEERGKLQIGTGETVLGELTEMVMPRLLLQVIDSRIDRLGPEVRAALEVASIIGQYVPTDVWQEVSRIDEESLFALADQAVEARLIAADRDGATVSFVHALTREVLYDGVSPFRRRGMHGKTATTLLGRSSPEPDSVSFHLQRAGDPAAVDWLIVAGERAQRAYAWLTAHDRFAAAAELLKDEAGQEERRAWLLYALSRLMRYSDQPAGMPFLSEAAELAGSIGNLALAAECRYSAGVLNWFMGDFASALSQMECACLDLEAAGDSLRLTFDGANSWLADAVPLSGPAFDAEVEQASQALAEASFTHRRGSYGWTLAAAGMLEESHENCERFLKLVEPFADAGALVQSARGHAEQGLGIAGALRGEPESATCHLAKAIKQYERLDHHAVIGFTLLAQLEDVVLPYQTDRPVERRRIAAAAANELESAAGAFAAGINPSRVKLNVWFLDGNWELMDPVIHDSDLPVTCVLRRPVTTASAALYLARGEFQGLDEVVTSVLPEGPSTPPFTKQFREATILQIIAAQSAIETGNLSSAAAWLNANEQWLVASGAWLGRAEHALVTAMLKLASGEPEAAQEQLRRVLLLDQQQSIPLTKLRALRLEANMAAETGQFERAQSCLQLAVTLATECELPYEEALTWIEMANLAKLTGNVKDIEVAQAKALPVLSALRAVPALERLARVTGSKDAQSISTHPAGLTPREAEVLILVAQGLTDAAVGECLFISSRTVSQHLRSIYGKLGVATRSAATRFAIEHNLA